MAGPLASHDESREEEPQPETISLLRLDQADISTASGTDSETASGSESEIDAVHLVEQSASQSVGVPMKRKAEEDSSKTRPKMARPSTTVGSSKNAMKFPDGALRITRTPGRQTAKNCVNLEDLIDKKSLVSACIFSFFIANEELFPHLPLSQSSNVPIYIGRDPNMDPMVPVACQRAGITIKGKLTRKQLDSIGPSLSQLHKRRYGKNYHSFYAWSSGSSHSKILVLMYPTFLRLVITSCNMMDIDTMDGDNHWYIHDIPKLPVGKKHRLYQFEDAFLAHLQSLKAPLEFVGSIEGLYDFSNVKIHLVTSVPGTKAGINAEIYGLLRFRRIVKNLDLDLWRKSTEGKLRLDVCAASIGNLNAQWLNGFHDCITGKEDLEVATAAHGVPDLRLFYPTVGDVKSAHPSAQSGASNIGCHTRPWDTAPADVKKIFHHYRSKDTGRLFHQKFILAYTPEDMTAAPYFVYIGSANLSQSAWGALEVDKRGNQATCGTKLVKMSSFECGVVIPGYLIKDLLEPGTESWVDGLVPYDHNARQYDLGKRDRPWNDPRWVQDYREDYDGD
ncbi:ubiquitin interaction domain-containing protein [Seiridium cupressi]